MDKETRVICPLNPPNIGGLSILQNLKGYSLKSIFQNFHYRNSLPFVGEGLEMGQLNKISLCCKMIILISNPAPVKDEHKIISQIFDEGLEIFHLRKKEFQENELRSFIENIPEKNWQKIVLHSHYHLAGEYGLRGIHVPPTFKGEMPDGTLSVSFHTVEEILKSEIPFDYGFLSPVFDSISKEGYQSRFKAGELKLFLKDTKAKIIALGGIDEDKIETVREMGFSGIALLGAVWQNEQPVDKFKQIKNLWLK